MTAAHCFTYIKDANKLFIQYGSTELNPLNIHRENVTRIIWHEGYSPTIAIHDIALLKLEQPLKFTHNVKPVQLPKTGMQVLRDDGKVQLLGWGLNETSGVLQANLKKVQLQLVNLGECRSRLGAAIHASNLCAGVPENLTSLKGQCSGDSGGPLLQRNTQIGIASWSLKPCGIQPSVFTKIAYYKKWIHEKTKEIK